MSTTKETNFSEYFLLSRTFSMVSNYLLENRRSRIRVFDASSQPFYRSTYICICSLSYNKKITYSLMNSRRIQQEFVFIRFYEESMSLVSRYLKWYGIIIRYVHRSSIFNMIWNRSIQCFSSLILFLSSFSSFTSLKITIARTVGTTFRWDHFDIRLISIFQIDINISNTEW